LTLAPDLPAPGITKRSSMDEKLDGMEE